MVNEDLLNKRYRLVTTDTYAEIRKEAIDYIMTCSSSSIPSEVIRGMLMLVNQLDSFKSDYERALRGRKD